MFDFSEVQVPSEVLPQGQYKMRLDNMENTRSKKGDGMFCARWKVIEGSEKDATIFEYYMYEGAGAVFGQRKIKKMLEAIGKPLTFSSVDDLVGGECNIGIKHVPDTYNGSGMKPEISYYAKITEEEKLPF